MVCFGGYPASGKTSIGTIYKYFNLINIYDVDFMNVLLFNVLTEYYFLCVSNDRLFRLCESFCLSVIMLLGNNIILSGGVILYYINILCILTSFDDFCFVINNNRNVFKLRNLFNMNLYNCVIIERDLYYKFLYYNIFNN